MTTLYTPRLILRPFTIADAMRVQELAGDARVARTTLHVPHPYLDGMAESWIATHQPLAETGEAYIFAITLAGTRTPGREADVTDTGHLIGSIGLSADATNIYAGEIGYWIGHPYWNKGFATEAANAVLTYAFTKRGLTQVNANHRLDNPASGRVMQKLGMTRQPGTRNGEKNGEPFVLVDYLLTRDQWNRRRYIHRWKPSHSVLAI
jgi:RimJ/RimL family protein N-acetyltransferase